MFSSGFSLTTPLPVPPIGAITTNSLFLSNLHLISRRRIHGLTSVTGRRGKTVFSPSSTSSSVLKITCGVIKEIKETEFSEVVLKSDRPVLVEFVATWCGPCRLIAPAIESLAQVYFFV